MNPELEPDSPVPPQQFKDRKAGLVVFGILTILAGCVCALFVPLMLLAPKMAAQSGQLKTPPAVMIAPAVIYAAVAIDFVWLGVGSFMARRWARTLLAIQSWTGVVLGLFVVGFFAFMGSSMKEAMKTAAPPNQPPMPEAMQSVVVVVTACFVGFFFVILPLVWALFYSGRNVKATCEALDPRPRWTDRCPAPVLAASFWIAFGAVGMLGTMAHGVAPLFGTFLVGTSARVFYLLLAAIWAYCAWAVYRLDRRGWWIICAAIILVAISSVLTFSHHDIAEMYASMGYSQDDLQRLRAFSASRFATFGAIAWAVPSLGYLLYIRRFFRATPAVELSPKG